MPLVYVTGIAGAGKSTVCEQLRGRGYDAYDTDRDGIAVWVNRETGEITDKGALASERPPDWLEQHEWRMVPARVKELAQRSKGRRTFLCGSTANEKAVWHYFSKVIYLAIDEATLLSRLAGRTPDAFGRSPHELAVILEWYRGAADRYRAYGASIADATQPLDDVVDDVVDLAGTRAPMMSRWLFKSPRVVVSLFIRRPSADRGSGV